MSIPLNEQTLVQIGFYQFSNINTKRVDSSNLKTNLSDTNYTDGKIKNNGLNRDYKDDLEYNIQFFFDHEKDDIHSIMKMMYDEPQIVFFVEKYNQKHPFGRLNNGKEDYRILYNYAQIITPIRRATESRIGNTGFEHEFTIRLMTPFKYECDVAKLQYVEKKDLPKFKGQVWGSFSTTWGGGGNWGSDILGLANNFNNQSQLIKKLLLETNNDCTPSILFLYDDIFYRNTGGQIVTGNQKTNRYIQYDLSTTIGFTTQLLVATNEPLANAGDLFTGQGLDLLSNAPNIINQIEIESYNGVTPNLSALVQNESISVYNSSTKSGFKITWLGANTPCPSKLIIRSHIQDGIFDGNGTFLDPYNEYQNQFRLEYLPNSNSNYLLEFRSLYPYNQNLNLEQGDNLELRHNIISPVNATPKITIKNLKIWH
jgi:hypothetical protein